MTSPEQNARFYRTPPRRCHRRPHRQLRPLRAGEPRKYAPPREDDPARQRLRAVVEARGPAIDRAKGVHPPPGWQDRALAYIEAEHKGFILSYVRRLRARHIPEEDLVQAATIGALRALETFDLDKAGRFLTAGKWWIRCETGKLVNRNECLVVIPPDVKRERERLLREVPDDMGDEDASATVNLPVERVRELRQTHLGHEHRRMDERSGSVRRTLATVRAEAAERQASVRTQALVWERLSRLSPVARRLLYEHLGMDEMLAEDNEAKDAQTPKSKAARRVVLETTLDEMRQDLAELL